MSQDVAILLVDDHPLVRKALRAQIEEQAGLHVVGETGNADEALSLAMSLQPHVLVMDIDMPGMVSFEAARILKTRCPEILVIFLSAFARDQYIHQALSVQAAGYVCKSEPPDTVIRAIRSAVQGCPYFSPEVRSRIVVDAGAGLLTQGQARLALLSDREIEVLRYLARGLAKKEIARLMHISEHTVHRHTDRLMDKLEMHDRVELARFAIREGLAEA